MNEEPITRKNVHKKLLQISIVVLVATLCVVLLRNSLEVNALAVAFIFVMAAGLWIVEAIPLYATSILIIAMIMVLLGKPFQLSLERTVDYKAVINAAADPVILLFFGCFVLASAARKHNLDQTLAHYLLKPFGQTPGAILAGIISITALFSMWMSNTATTAMMISVLAPVLSSLEDDDYFRKGLVLAVAFAANIGGIGTPIGTPPNAIAIGILRQSNINLGFFQWMLIAVPLMVALLVVLWVLIYISYVPEENQDMALRLPEPKPLTLKGATVSITFALTAALWLTNQVHGISSAVIAMLPLVVFTALNILNPEDINSLNWDVLILLSGALTLGSAVQWVGLDVWVTSQFPFQQMSTMGILAIFVLLAAVLSNFMSNTAAASLIIPLIVSIPEIPPVYLVVCTALAASMAMGLPVSTPPNAMAYATGEISNRDMLKTGLMVMGISCLCIILTSWYVFQFWGFL